MKNIRKWLIAPFVALQLMLGAVVAPTVIAPIGIATTLAVGSLSLVPLEAHAGAMPDFLENKLIDFLYRGQSYTAPTSRWIALATTTGSDTACGTEVSGGGYSRVQISSSLANWAGTQSAGSTAVSSGTSGTTSNNIAITWGTAPTANWGNVTEFCEYDASTGGNLLDRAALTAPKNISNGDAAPSFAIGALTFQVDN